MNDPNTINISCPCCDAKTGKVLYENVKSVYSDSGWGLTECISCGNILTTPVPERSIIEHIYSDTYQYPVHLLILDEKKLRARSLSKFIRKIVPTNKSTSVFEVGCMYGYLLDELKKDYNVKGIEIGKGSVDFCKTKGLDVADISLEDYLNKNDEKFDVIVLSHVLEHLLATDNIIRQLSGRLNPGGRLVICVPNSNSICRNIFGRYWGWWQVPVHINHFSENSMRKLGEKAGLKTGKPRYKGGDSLMLLLNFINLYRYKNENKKPGFFQTVIIKSWSFLFRYWYFTGNEELTVVMEK